MTAAGFVGETVMSATATPGPPGLIVVDAGNSQEGAIGQPLPRPFVATVVDSGSNRLGGVPVTFTVKQGGGSFDGQPTLTVPTDSDGRAVAVLALGSEEGIENNVVKATFAGNTGSRATFVASGKLAGDPAQTRISGVVLDNSNTPIQGVTLHVEGTSLTTQSDAQGQFVVQPAPVGHVLLIADGSTVPPRNGMPWPKLEYELVTIAGQDNTVGMPMYLLPIDTPRGVLVDETHGGTLTLDELPGFALTVVPGSVTFLDGGKRGTVSVTLVHADKVPMVPNFGRQPRFIITIQPAGTHFNPPAPITFPNVGALAPGQINEFFSFDHDLGQFVSIGTGSVSEDGRVIRSDPGVGILKGGWHEGGGGPGGGGNNGPGEAEPVTVEILPQEGSGSEAQPLLQLEGERIVRAAEAISSENVVSVLVGEEVEVTAAGRPLPEGSPPFDWEFVDEEQQVVEKVEVRPGQKTEDSLQSIVKLKGLQPGETTLKVTYRASSGSESEKEATAELKVIVTQEEGALILTNIQPTIVVPSRPAGFVQRHYPQGVLTNDGFVTNPNALSDLQLFYDIIATVQLSPAAVLNSVVNNMFAAVRRVIRDTFEIELTLKPTPGFTVAPESFTPADREYLTLLFLERSTNSDLGLLPEEFFPENLFKYPQTEYRQLHELRFEYHLDSEGKFKVFKERARKQFVGATPFRLPVFGSICWETGIPELPIICVPVGAVARFFPGQYVTGNLPVLTDQTGGEEETFIEQVLYSRAGATLRPFEDILLNFPGPAFFSEIRFNIDTEETPPLTFVPVMGHSPTHTWPSHYPYRWNKELKKYERAGAYPQTGQRGPFPGFLDVFASPPGGVSSPTHKQCCPYPPG